MLHNESELSKATWRMLDYQAFTENTKEFGLQPLGLRQSSTQEEAEWWL